MAAYFAKQSRKHGAAAYAVTAMRERKHQVSALFASMGKLFLKYPSQIIRTVGKEKQISQRLALRDLLIGNVSRCRGGGDYVIYVLFVRGAYFKKPDRYGADVHVFGRQRW